MAYQGIQGKAAMAKRIIAMLLTIVMTFGMVIPASAAEAPESPAPTAEVVVVEAEPETEEEAAPEETPVASEPQEDISEETPAPEEEPSELPEETAVPEPTAKPEGYVIMTGDGEDPAAVSTEGSVAGEKDETSYSQEKVDEFIGLYLVAEGVEYPIDEEAYEEAGEEIPAVYFEVTEENYKQVLEAEEAWAELTTAEQEAVDAVICAAYVDSLIEVAEEEAEASGIELTEEDIESIRETVETTSEESPEEVPSFEAMFVKAEDIQAAMDALEEEAAAAEEVEADDEENTESSDGSIVENMYSGILGDEDIAYVAADSFSFADAGEKADFSVSFFSGSTMLLGNSNFGIDTETGTLLDDEKFIDQNSDLVIHPHYGQFVLSGTKIYIDWYDNQGDYWGMNARTIENILGLDQYGVEHQVFCISPGRKFYDYNTNKTPGYDWNKFLSESQRKAIALTCLYGTNGDHYLQAAAQLIIFELATKYRSSTDFSRWYTGWHSVGNGYSSFDTYVEPYYYDLPYQLYLHGSSPSWMYDTHDEAVAATYDLTQNTTTGNYEITISNTDSKMNGADARKKDWVNRFEYVAYADPDYTKEISGVTFTSVQNTSSSGQAKITISVPATVYNSYGEIYIKVKTPSLKTSSADYRLWIPDSSSTTAGQTFIELISGEAEPAYAYMTLRAGGEANEFELTVNKVAMQLADGYTRTSDGVTYVNPYGVTSALTGVTFGLYKAVDENGDGTPDTDANGAYILGELVSQQEVDSTGAATWSSLNPELKYVVVEESAPILYSISKWENGQYLVDNTTAKSRAVEITAENQVRYFTFSISKKDFSTGTALSGVTFGIYAAEDITWQDGYYDRTNTIAADTLVGQFTTGTSYKDDDYTIKAETTNGVTKVTVCLPVGTYYIKELSAPSGYEIDSTKYTVIDFDADETTTDILNEDDDTLMSSQFQTLELYNKHVFSLTATKKAKVLADPYTRSSDGVTYVNAYSDTYALSGVKLGLYETVDANSDGTPDTNADGSYVLGTSKGEKTVNSSGQATWTGLDDSKVYVLKELEVPLQYSSSANANGEVLVDNTTARNTTVEIEITNYPRYVEFSIAKKGADTGAYLAGATFGIYAATTVSWTDYYDNSTNTIAADTLVGTFTTGTDKTDSNFPMKVTTVDGVTTVIMQVPLGEYYIKEISAPSGYELDETEYTVVKYAGSETTSELVKCTNTSYTWMGFYAETLSTQNGAQTIINKVPDKEYFDLVVNKYGNAITGITGYDSNGATSGYTYDYQTPLSDLSSVAALFRLYEAVDADGDGVADLDSDGYYAITGTLVSEQWTDSEGKLYWYGLDKDKQYILHEAAAPATYNKPSFLGNRILVTPDANTVTYEVDANNGSSYIYLSIRKLDSETSKPIQGAVFGVYMGEDMYVPGTTTVAVPKDTLLTTGTTDADGYIWGMGDRAILPGYKYYVKEISVPDAWVLDTTKYYLDVFEDYVTYDMMVCTNVDSTNGANAWDHTTTYYINGTGNAYYYYNDPSEPVYYPFESIKLNEFLDSVTENSDGTLSFEYAEPYGWAGIAMLLQLDLVFANLEGKAEYAVYAAEDIYDAQGDLVYSAGDRVKVYRTVANDDTTIGDVNMDGSITAGDSSLVLKYEAGLESLTDEQLRRADINGDGWVDSLDATLIGQFVVNMIEGSYFATRLEESDVIAIGFPNSPVYWVKNPGTYTVTEVSAPFGMAVSNLYDSDDNTFVIADDATSYTLSNVLNFGPALSGIANVEGEDRYGEWPSSLEATIGTVGLDYAEKLGFRVYKVDSETNTPLSGATFGLYAATDYSAVMSQDDITSAYIGSDGEWHFTANYTTVIEEGDLIATATTNSAGYAVFDVDVPTNDPDMAYYIMEITAPSGYAKSYESWGPYTVKELLEETINDGISSVTNASNTHTWTVTYENRYVGYGNLYIEKTGEELVNVTQDDNGNTKFVYTYNFLEGATFNVYAAETIKKADGTVVYNEGDLVRSGVTTNDNGIVIIENLYLGKYKVVELNAPNGYVAVLSTEYTGDIPGLDLVGEDDSTEDDEEDSRDADTVVEVESTMTREETLAEIMFSTERTVDMDGSVTLGDYTASFWNPRQIAKVSVTKVEDGTNTPLAGAVFGLYAEDNIYSVSGALLVSAGDLIAQATSAEGGIAEFDVDLPIGHKYSVRELVAPDGYVRSTEKYTFTFNYTNQNVAVQRFTTTFKNSPEAGNLIIHKNGEAPITATPNDLYDETAGYTITAATSPLSGAVYDVYAASSVTYNGKSYSSGTRILSNLTTDAFGKIVIEGLSSGTYRIVEKTAPDGYVISVSEQTVTFNANDASTSSVTFTDERKKINVVIYKEDAVYNTALAGATFALMTGDNDVLVGDTTIPANTIIETAVSQADGYVNFTMDQYLPLGYTYKVIEIEAPDKYELSDEEFVFTYQKGVSVDSTNTITASATFLNDHGPNWEEPGKITVTKTDENGNPLAGAVFKLEYSANNGTTWAPVYYSVEALGGNYLVGATTSSVTNGTLTTDASGVIVFSELKADGNVMYRLTETQAPDGYTLPDDPVIFRGTLPVADATAPGGTDYEIEFTVVNEFKPGSLTVKKVSTFGIALAGATYLLEYSTDDGATWANIKAADPGQSTPKVGTTTATGLSGGTLTTTASTNPVVFSDLRADGTVKYRLTEVKAPDGYDLVTETIYEGYLPLENGDDDVFEISIVVHNSPVIKLPHTGASGFLFPALGACFGTGAGVVGILLGKRKKGKHSKD